MWLSDFAAPSTSSSPAFKPGLPPHQVRGDEQQQECYGLSQPFFTQRKENIPTMASYKEPSFQERAALAQQARERALKKLAAKPAPDPAELAKLAAARLAREQAQAEKSAARKAELAAAKAEKQAKAQAAAEAASTPVLTEAERKAARDERYAARKMRKK